MCSVAQNGTDAPQVEDPSALPEDQSALEAPEPHEAEGSPPEAAETAESEPPPPPPPKALLREGVSFAAMFATDAGLPPPAHRKQGRK
jgi:hypothetical protein